jgi:predicted ATPase
MSCAVGPTLAAEPKDKATARRDLATWNEGLHVSADEDVSRDYRRIWSLMGARQIEDLVDFSPITNPAVLDALDVLTEVVTPALFTDEKLLVLVICQMVNLSLEYGERTRMVNAGVIRLVLNEAASRLPLDGASALCVSA